MLFAARKTLGALGGVSMRALLYCCLLMLSSSVYGADDWVVLTPDQQQFMANDVCAAAAVDAAVTLIAEEIRVSGADYPAHLYLFDLQVSTPEKSYLVTFKGDFPIRFETKKTGLTCQAQLVKLKPDSI